MFGHLPELIIVLVIALIFFGPEKLPEAAASAGKAIREMREVMDTALHPHDEDVSEDFSTYYYESLERSGDDFSEESHDFDADGLDADDADPTVAATEPEADHASGAHPINNPSEFHDAPRRAPPV
ncbi:MAG: hypothetical protein NVSMB22_11500 [Chloroflexota bacterium]